MRSTRLIDSLRFRPRLVEEAVWRATRGRVEERAFDSAREEIYEIADPEERERAFVLFYGSWFEKLGVGDPVLRAIGERRTCLAGVRRMAIIEATTLKQEGAELFVAEFGQRSVVVAILPATLLDHCRAMVLLRRELMHIADMLDPRFEYEPRLRSHRIGPANDRLLQDRYRVLWNCSVDGRLLREGRLEACARKTRLREFGVVFTCLGERIEEGFARFFDGPRPSHPQFVAFAENPDVASGLRRNSQPTSARCPLCGFPTTAFEPAPGGLPPGVVDNIQLEFGSWTPEQGLCRQCADLYRARTLSPARSVAVP